MGILFLLIKKNVIFFILHHCTIDFFRILIQIEILKNDLQVLHDD